MNTRTKLNHDQKLKTSPKKQNTSQTTNSETITKQSKTQANEQHNNLNHTPTKQKQPLKRNIQSHKPHHK